jgi:hypothetical protein
VRTKELTIRMTEAELSEIRAKAKSHKVGMADLVRRLLAEAEHAEVKPTGRKRGLAPRQRPAPAADPKLVLEVARIGNNLNQLARWANTYKGGADAVEVLAVLTAIDRTAKEILFSYCPKEKEGEGGGPPGDAH